MDLSDIACDQPHPADKPAIFLFMLVGVLLLYASIVTVSALIKKKKRRPIDSPSITKLPQISSLLFLAAIISTWWSVNSRYKYWANELLSADRSKTYSWVEMKVLHCTMGHSAIICWFTLASAGVLVLLAFYLQHLIHEDAAKEQSGP